MTTQDYITPTKESPIFVAECDWFGFIGGSLYKEYIVNENDGQSCGETFSLHFKDSVNRLHEWIENNENTLKEYPKCKFNIYMINGSLDKDGRKKYEKVYTITASKAKKLLF